ncbi:MAG: oxygen-independent coproporphyrinogen III oxidase [Breznakibacter sp.]
MKVPKNLLDKYNQALPRYTSYPPANHFKAMDNDAYIRLLDESNTLSPSNISIYIHIPFCHKICFYCGCNSMRLSRPQTVTEYVEAIKKEILMVKDRLDGNRKVSQIHYGGGTPNAIPVEMLMEINRLIFDNFRFIDKPEIAIECHPAHLYPDTIEKLVQGGFNRISLGIQDFDASVLKAVNREPSRMPVDQITRIFKSLQPEGGINLDFIYGLPYQTPQSFLSSMAKAIELNPDRVVTFSYAHVPWVKNHMQALEKMGLPLPETKMQMFEESYLMMVNAGYTVVGMDHYAKATDELALALADNELHRNFQGYCTRRTTGQVYAFGVSGIGQMTGGYAQNTKSVETYIQAIGLGQFAVEKGAVVNEQQKIIRDVIDQLMCNRLLQWDKIGTTYGISPWQVKEAVGFDMARFSGMADDGLLSIDAQGVTVSELGRFFIRNIASSLDPMLANGTNMYSKSV